MAKCFELRATSYAIFDLIENLRDLFGEKTHERNETSDGFKRISRERV